MGTGDPGSGSTTTPVSGPIAADMRPARRGRLEVSGTAAVGATPASSDPTVNGPVARVVDAAG